MGKFLQEKSSQRRGMARQSGPALVGAVQAIRRDTQLAGDRNSLRIQEFLKNTAPDGRPAGPRRTRWTNYGTTAWQVPAIRAKL